MGRNFLRDVAVVVVAILVVLLLFRMPRWWSEAREAPKSTDFAHRKAEDNAILGCIPMPTLEVPEKSPFTVELPRMTDEYPSPDYEHHLRIRYQDTNGSLERVYEEPTRAGQFSVADNHVTFSRRDAGKHLVTSSDDTCLRDEPPQASDPQHP